MALIQSEWLSARSLNSVDAHETKFFASNDAAGKVTRVDVRIPFNLIRHNFFEKIFEGFAIEILFDLLRDCDVTEADVFVSPGVVVVKKVLKVAQPNLEQIFALTNYFEVNLLHLGNPFKVVGDVVKAVNFPVLIAFPKNVRHSRAGNFQYSATAKPQFEAQLTIKTF